MSLIWKQRNAFQRTLAGFSYSGAPPCTPDLFSQACIEAYEISNPRKFGYQFTQIFEPGVLDEVALLEHVPAQAMETLQHCPTAGMEHLQRRLEGRDDLLAVERINLASVLISISRFDAAERARPEVVHTAKERFELGWIDFLISNRRDDGAASPDAFSRMIRAAKENGVASCRILDACIQGIVWYLKRREIDDDQYRWCVGMGRALIDRQTALDSGTISSWYRALAMVPAAKGDAKKTRDYMSRAYDHATRVASDSNKRGAKNALKTYYESCIKEFMYVRPNLQLAEQAGLALIEMDDVWSLSYAELAEAYARFGRTEKATEYFIKAAEAGPPYLGHHLVSAARAHAKLDDPEEALRYYVLVNEIAPMPNYEICQEALNLATRCGQPMRDYFRDAVDRAQPVPNK